MSTIWNQLKFRAGKPVIQDGLNALSSIRYRYSEKPDGTLKFKSKAAYKFATAHWAKREAMALAANEINQLFPRLQRSMEKKLRETVQAQQQDQVKWIIKNSDFTENNFQYGQIKAQGGHTIYARDSWGNTVKEALMIYYDGEEEITVTESIAKSLGNGQVQELSSDITTKTVYFCDCIPKVTISSGKNIVMTPVVGRDYTRKELVSGGDLTFQVSGSIVSPFAALETDDKLGTSSKVKYPENDVKKFIQIMKHPGIINVNHFLFRQFNVTRIIIKDFSLKMPEFKNIQPYEFTCVAVEPDEDVIVKQDTINNLDRELITNPMDKWYKLVLDNKLGEIAADVTTDIVRDATSLGLDKLTFGARI